MKLEKIKIGNKKVMPFTIPSGIITTQVKCLEKIAQEIPELGILTTKSIGPNVRAGNREPILAQYIPGGFVNAVGLTNPGAEEFAQQLSTINFPEDKFLLASIFGSNSAEFVYVAENLEERVDGFELNLSCPHCDKVGMALGQDPEMVRKITKEVVKVTKKPVFAKLTPNTEKIEGGIGIIARAAIEAGAYGISAINTVGPIPYEVDGFLVLTNKVGGKSGRGIRDVGIQRVKEIIETVGNIPMIIMGGISNARDVEKYRNVVGYDNVVFGIGTSLVGMKDAEIIKYFPTLINDLKNGTNYVIELLKKVDMNYKKVNLERKIDCACDLKLLVTNISIEAEPGQFVFAWIPGVGEKPFSIMDNNPLTLGVLERGEFTKKFNSLEEGDYFYIRGPYGKGVSVPKKSNMVLVGGGCGIAGLYLLAKKFSKDSSILTLLAAKDKEHILYSKEFEKCGRVEIATENGSLGKKGLVSDLMRNLDLKKGSYFLNCGPRQMISAVLPLELEISSPERIFFSIDYMTRCGVGICGSCADENGRRTCVEGPFMMYK
ncbi:tRNA-dihydrouridine synthase [Candidatus Woesearchaeota archaeon]|nr:tRNA-dihydrouridine synthase [Candidatus Woesearchaeota archaeon]